MRLQSLLREILPRPDQTRWSGQVVETNDGFPYIGQMSDHQFVATGYAGNGLTFGTLAAIMARDAAFGRVNPWRSSSIRSRTTLVGGAWDYVKENLDYPYYMLKDRLTTARGDRNSTRSVRRGEGRY